MRRLRLSPEVRTAMLVLAVVVSIVCLARGLIVAGVLLFAVAVSLHRMGLSERR